MRQLIAGRWTIDLDSTFTRHDTEGGDVVFASPAMAVRVHLARAWGFKADKALRDYLVSRYAQGEDLPFYRGGSWIAVQSCLARRAPERALFAIVACYGWIADLKVELNEDTALEDAWVIVSSLRHRPPPWATFCARAEPPLEDLREALEPGSTFSWSWVVESAEDRGQISQLEQALLMTFDDPFPSVRTAACRIAELLPSCGQDLRNGLRERLHDDAVRVRAAAACALLNFGEPPEEVVPFLAEGLSKREPPLPAGEARDSARLDRYYAAKALLRFGQSARPTRQALLEHRMDESGFIRVFIALALHDLGEPPSVTVPALRDGLHDAAMSRRERMAIASTMARLGVQADELLPTVISTLPDLADDTPILAALYVVRVAGKEAARAGEAIEALLTNRARAGKPFPTRTDVTAARMLIQIGQRISVALPVLLAALEKEIFMEEILMDLRLLDTIDHVSLSRIAHVLDCPDFFSRVWAAILLAKHDHKTPHAILILMDFLKSAETRDQRYALMRQEDDGTDPGVTGFIRNLAKNDRQARMEAIEVLGHVAAQDTAVAAFLAHLAQTGDDETRRCAAEALGRLQKTMPQ